MYERFSGSLHAGGSTTARPAATGPSVTAGVADAHAAQQELSHCLEELAALPGADVETCHWLRDKLSAAIFNLVVAGQFKRGKSALINALLGESVLPVGVVPLTSVVTAIEYGSAPAALIELSSGERLELPLEALEQYVTERGNPRNIKGVSRVHVRYPCAWLGREVRLVDTPGIDSVYEHNTGVTRAFIPQADAVIFVVSVEQPLSRAELDFLQAVRQYAGKIFCVLNKIDQLSPAELHESVSFTAGCLQEAFGAPVHVFPVSARAALQAHTGHDGTVAIAPAFHELREALTRFMQTGRTAVWRRSIAATLLRMLSQVRFTVELERRTLDRPLEQLRAALAVLRAQKEESLRAQTEQSLLLQAQAAALLRERVEPQLRHFKEDQQQRIGALMGTWYRELRSLGSRELQAALEQRLTAEVRNTYDGWLAREERGLSEAFDAACARFWTQSQRALDELLARCGEQFGLSFQPLATASVWRAQSGFGYRFWSEPTSLRFLSSAALLALPKVLGGPLLVRRLRVRAADLVETHAGRLRSDLEQRLHRSVEEFRARLLAHMSDTIGRIEQAIARGIDRYASNRADAAARSAQLSGLLERIDGIEARIHSSTDDSLAHS